MSCNKKNNCFELEEPKCKTGCDENIKSGCVFFNLDGDQTLRLVNLGILSSTSLDYILKKIDDQFGQSQNANFSLFNLHGLNVGTEIKTLKQFVEAITLKQSEDEESIKENSDLLDILKDDLLALQKELSDLNSPSISNLKVGVNNTDDIKEVLVKILSYISSLSEPVETTYQDSETIDFSASGNEVTANVVLDDDPNNIIKNTGKGIYAAHKSTSSVLQNIKDSNQLKSQFKDLVVSSLPCFAFDILNSDSDTIIKYINCNGDDASDTARKNILLPLENVRRVVTSPTKTLAITFKGI